MKHSARGRSFSRAPLLLVLCFALPAFAAKLPQTITFDQPWPQIVGAQLALQATASSGLPVTFASKTGPVCSVHATVATMLKAGVCTIEASQAGNAQYSAAPKVQRSFAVTVAQADGVTWTKVGPVYEWWGGAVQSNYTSITIESGGIRMFSNLQDLYGTAGDLQVYSGTWSMLAAPIDALHIGDPRDAYIRTLGVAKGASGMYYAVLYTGDGYPTQGGYSPSWATSPDGLAWTWWGPISPFGRNQSSAANLIVDESRNDGYRFMAWMDIPSGLMLVHSDTGMPGDWQSDGVNVWPIAGEVPQFPAAVQTPYGYHLIGADTYPATKLRHVFSCTGLPPWHVIETASDVINPVVGKGTNLVYDPATNLVHALSSGVHWTLPARDFGC